MKPTAKVKNSKAEHFVRIVPLPPKPGDTFASYQPEIITVIDDQVVERTLKDKPNFFEYAHSAAADLIDPRNKVEPA